MLNFNFSAENLNTILSGTSAIDHKKLEINDLESAHRFIKSYGFDLNKPDEMEEVWYYHRKAISILKEHLMTSEEQIPDMLSDAVKLNDVGNLLIFASQKDNLELQKWSCAILRVMHAFAHIQNDIFSQFSDQIQEQVLNRYHEFIIEDRVSGVRLGNQKTAEQIALYKFEVKPFKRTSSSVIKLLSKPKAVAFTLLDRLGVRFITRSLVDSFRVIRFLINENIVSLPNIMPEQSNNTLYPANLFLEVLNKTDPMSTYQALEVELLATINSKLSEAEYVVKRNEFSSPDYKFIKFVARQLIEAEIGGKKVHFFFPYEIQIMDYATHINNLAGAKSHEEYKKRQKIAARQRVIGNTLGNFEK